MNMYTAHLGIPALLALYFNSSLGIESLDELLGASGRVTTRLIVDKPSNAESQF